MIPENSPYATIEYNFPTRDVDPKTKGSEYCFANARTIWSLFLRNKTAYGPVGWRDFTTSRDYSRGEQDINQYKSWLMNDPSSGDGSETSYTSYDDTPVSRISKREGWQNLQWKNVSPAPMILSAIHGIMDQHDYDLYVDTIDANSKALKEEQKYLKLVEAQNADWQIEFKKKAGIPVDEDVVFPKSVEELAMYEAKDGFKLNVARAMQKLLRHSFNLSDWDGTIRKKIVDDLVVLGYGAARDVYDSEDSKWKLQYLDPAKLVIQYSNEYDYNDSEYAGYFRYATISNLRDKLPDVPEVEWKNLARSAYTLYNNPRDSWENFYSQLDPTTSTYRYDGFKVPIFECEWIDNDTEKKLYYTSKQGRKTVYKLDWDTKEKTRKRDNGGEQEVKHIFTRVVRQCTWVVNTEYVYDYGIVNMAAREGLSKPRLTFHVEQLLQPSIIKNIIPILDQISQLFLRWQNSLAMMVERGYAINTTMLANVMMGGEVLKPAQVLKLWRQTGTLLYTYNSPNGMGSYGGGAALPVSPMDGGLGARVQETLEAMEMQFRLLERFTGINMMMLGATPDPNAPVGTSQASVQASMSVLKPILKGIEEIKKISGTSVMRRLQIGLRTNQKIREAYSGVIAPNDMEAIVMMESEGVQYGLDLKPRPDDKQKLRFENWINIALQNTREQRPGIDLNDAIYFMSQLENGADISDLEKQLEYAIEKNKQEAQKNAVANMQAQSQANAQAEQSKMQGELAKIQAETEGKAKEELVRGQVKASNTKLEKNYEFLQKLHEAKLKEEGILTGTGK